MRAIVEPTWLRLAIRAAICVAVAIVVPLPYSNNAEAFPRLDGSCSVGVSNLRYRFQNGTANWTPTERDNAELGIQAWDGYMRRSGAVFIRSERDSSGIPVIRNSTGTSFANCSNGVATSITIASNAVRRTARHEAGHAHGLGHSGNDDALTQSGAAGQPIMDGCAPHVTTTPTVDDRAQYAHERDGGSFTANVGFENLHSATYGGTWTRASAFTPYNGGFHAIVLAGDSVISALTRVTSLPADITARISHRGTTGTKRFLFTYRLVNYPAGSCQNNPQFNPNTFSWDNPTVGPWIVGRNIVLPSRNAYPSSPNAGQVARPSGGWGASHAIDYRLTAWNVSGDALYVDDMEAT